MENLIFGVKREVEIDVVFENEGPFEAFYAAEAWMKARNFSCGRGQRGKPSGILFGELDIQKWRNLSHPDQVALDGVLVGDRRHGPVHVQIFNTATAAAITAARAA